MAPPETGTPMAEDTGAVAAREEEGTVGLDAAARCAGKGTVGPVVAVLEPALLDLYAECDVGLSDECGEWVEGRARRVEESVAREAERCLGAAEDAWAGALADALDDQLAALGAREGAPHRLALVNPSSAPNAIQCAGTILGRCYDAPRGSACSGARGWIRRARRSGSGSSSARAMPTPSPSRSRSSRPQPYWSSRASERPTHMTAMPNACARSGRRSASGCVRW